MFHQIPTSGVGGYAQTDGHEQRLTPIAISLRGHKTANDLMYRNKIMTKTKPS